MVESGLPASPDCERFVLGSILTDDSVFVQAAGEISADDFSLEKHRRIFGRMGDLYRRGENLDRVTVANELMKHGELESVGGLAYISELDSGLPQIFNVDAYCRIVRDKSTLRKIIVSSQKLANQAMLQDTEPTVLLGNAQRNFLELSIAGSKPEFVGPRQIILEAGGPEPYLNRHDRKPGLQTGFTRLDRATGGLERGNMYVLAARPAMGKTALAGNVIENVIRCGGRVAFFSLEMPKDQILDRMICSRARINLAKFRAGHLNAEELERVGRSAGEICTFDQQLLIDDAPLRNAQEMHAAIRRLQSAGTVDLVVVDFLQKMVRGSKDRVSETTAVSGDLAAMLRDCKVPGLILCQLSRGPENRPDKRPELGDLRESGAIEQDAFFVGFIYREEYYKRDREDLRGLAELIIGKNRNGPDGIIDLVFIREIVKFENRMEERVNAER